MSVEHLDVLIIGAGLSGIGAAYHLMKHCPGKRFAILEGREALGGTWDLFRYPGIRSDSDMFTLGYNFKPWTNPLAIADGPSIRSYIAETAEENGIQQHIRFQHKVLKADWCSERATWTLQVQRGDESEPIKLSCQHLLMCTGYYRYEAGYTPEFKGRELFQGEFIHPQLWPENFDYSGKNVVVIGSGATAVTLVPAMADKAKHVTMLQRSPTYVVSRPAEDPIAEWLKKKFKPMTAYRITRWKNVLLGMLFYNMARKNPEKTKERIIGMVRTRSSAARWNTARKISPASCICGVMLPLASSTPRRLPSFGASTAAIARTNSRFLSDWVTRKLNIGASADLVQEFGTLCDDALSGFDAGHDQKTVAIERATERMVVWMRSMTADDPMKASDEGGGGAGLRAVRRWGARPDRALSTAPRKRVSSKGLTRNSCAPARIASTALLIDPLAVMTMTQVCGEPSGRFSTMERKASWRRMVSLFAA